MSRLYPLTSRPPRKPDRPCPGTPVTGGHDPRDFGGFRVLATGPTEASDRQPAVVRSRCRPASAEVVEGAAG